MKLSAHPLMVAVAMGLLPAHALAESVASDAGTPKPAAGQVPGTPEADPSLDEAVLDTLLEALRVEGADVEG